MTRPGAKTAVFYIFILALGCFVNLSLFGYADDDAYIHFRIARNFIDSGAPYFNPTEPVMASSSSAWTVLLAFVFFITGASLKTVSVINAVVTTGCVYVYARVFDGMTDSEGLSGDLVSAAVALPLLAVPSLGMMETPLAMLALGTAVLLYMRGSLYSFILFGALPFIRPELAVFSLSFMAHNILTGRQPALRMFGMAAAGAAPFLAYGMAFFGTVFPQTITAKSAVYSLDPLWVLHFALPELFPVGELGRVAELVLIVWLGLAAAYAAVKTTPGRSGPAVPLAVSALLVLASCFAARAFVFPWYVPVYTLPVFLVMAAHAKAARSAFFAAMTAVALYPFVLGYATTLYAAAADPSAYVNFDNGARTAKYLEVGGRLREKYPEARVLTSEIGGLGYAFGGYIYDACGLASPEAVKYHPMPVPDQRHNGAVGAIPPGYVAEAEPDIIVSYENFDRALAASGLLKGYTRQTEDVFTQKDSGFAAGRTMWGSRELNVYIRPDKYKGAF